MKCPNCGLINPTSARRCDCGYNFDRRESFGTKLEIHFYQQDEGCIYLENSATGEALTFAEILTFCCLAVRQMVNLGAGRKSAIGLASILMGVPGSLRLLADCQPPETPRLVDYRGSHGRKRFVLDLSYGETFKFTMAARGFGLFARGVDYYAPNSVLLFLRYLARKQDRDNRYIQALEKAAYNCGNAFLAGKLSIPSQLHVALWSASEAVMSAPKTDAPTHGPPSQSAVGRDTPTPQSQHRSPASKLPSPGKASDALIEAVKSGATSSQVERLLNEGADPDATDSQGATALWWATANGRLEIVKLLLDRGADVHAVSGNLGETALMRVIVDTHRTLKPSPSKLEILRVLLDRTTDLSVTGRKGWHALKMAAWNGDLDTVRILLTKGAKIDHKDDEGMTAFMWAAHEGHVEVMKLLLENGADVNTKNVYGKGSLEIAIEQGDKAVIDLLVRNGAAEDRLIAAGQGDARAQVELGCLYDRMERYSEALKWYRKAAEQGEGEAQRLLADMYREGLAEEQDLFKAAEWCRRSAQQGNVAAQHNMGVMYARGEGVPKDPLKALEWWTKAAEQGMLQAQTNLGDMYRNGAGIPQNYAEAAKWYLGAAEQGDAKAQNALGNMYWSGDGVGQNFIEAVEWFRKAAEQGYPYAQENLGMMYEQGSGVPKDFSKAAEWYHKGAEQGLPSAQSRLAIILSVAGQDAEAAKWFRKAAEQGYAPAQAGLGMTYEQGKGVTQDYNEAMKWYRRAAEQGNEKARDRLEEMLRQQGC